jgi:hypothetical protein
VRSDPEIAADAGSGSTSEFRISVTERVLVWLDDKREHSPLLAEPPESLGELTSSVRNAPPAMRRAAEVYGLVAFLAVGALYGIAWVLRRPLRLALAVTYTLATLNGFGLFT